MSIFSHQLRPNNLTQKPGAYKIPFSCHYLHIGQNDHQISTKTHHGYKTRQRKVSSSKHSSETKYNIDSDETEALDTI
jgi:hypothetical protein